MIKQFKRMRQIADQTFLRAEKTEVLNQEELQVADQKVEFFHNALYNISKKIPSVSSEKTDNIEKRMKKYPEYNLGAVMVEQSNKRRDAEQVDDDSGLFQSIMRECGQVEMDLAKEQAEHEIKVEQMVSSPIHNILDVDLPNIKGQKNGLKKYILDKDSANSRYNATKNGNQKEALKDDLDEADIKVEQGRDVLASEMFNLLRKENELSQYMLQLLKLQRGYHESALKTLEKVIPELERKIGDSSVKAIFGISLEEHLRVTGRRIAFPIELCINALMVLGMSEEGLFRVAGGASRLKRFKLSLDSGCFKLPLIAEYRDVHVIASILKSYLRELPEPLLTYKLYDEWMSLVNIPEENRFRVVQDILKKLPQPNMDNLTYLMQFLAKLSKQPENKMTSSNIAIVMAPNLLWNADQEKNMQMSKCVIINLIVELFINRVETLFPDDVSVHTTLTKEMLFCVEEFQRPVLHNVRLMEHDPDITASSDSLAVAESPKPHSRRKSKPAPTPPIPPPKGETHEPKKEPKQKVSVGMNTDESTLRRRKSTAEADEKTPAALVTAQAQNVNSVFLESQRFTSHDYLDIKPVAAPRSLVPSETVNRTSSFKVDPMTKSLPTIDQSTPEEPVQLRKPDKPKPEVPVRPASLRGAVARSSAEVPEALQRTQCSVYNINKQQPNIVNIQKHQPGHDNLIAEKEKFLGHQTEQRVPLPRTSLENKFSDVNSNCPVRTRTNSVGNSNRVESNVKQSGDDEGKSKECVTPEDERKNGNRRGSHARTRSDGNIIDLGDRNSMRTSHSPRGISKPTLPPPPPPVNKIKSEPDSTNL